MLTLVAAYCLALLAVGGWASRRARTADEFFVAGRSLPSSMVFVTFFAANLGAGSTVGAAEFGYTTGLSAWWWVGCAGLGSILLALLVGPPLYRLARARGILTVGDFLELRYGRSTRLSVAAILLIGSPAILAGQIIAAGLVLQGVAGIPKHWGTAIGGSIATAYFAMGGLRSAARVNALQVAVKLVAFLAAVPWMLRASGGWPAVQAAAPGEAWLSVTGPGTVDLVLTLAPAFIVSPGLVQRLFGARDERAVRTGVGIQGAALLGFSILPVLLGMLARVHFPELPDTGEALIRLFTDIAPVWLGGLMLAALLSAELSSADAVLFMFSTSLSKDILAPLSGRRVDDALLVSLARASAVLAGLGAIVLANWFQSVLSALSFFYSLLTLTLFVPLLAGLFSKTAGQPTALASIGCSLAAAAASAWLGSSEGSLLQPVPAGIAAGGAVYAASVLLGATRRNETRRSP